MNLSGKAVKYWLDKENIARENLLVIVDDKALPLEKLRIRPGGSDGGHNGLKSIQESLGTTEYHKLRFGIGDNFPKGKQVNFVLDAFNKDELPEIPALIDRSIEMIKSFVTVGTELTMTRYNK